MVHCERCGSRFHSARALIIENCPRCLLRDDVAAPLKVEEVDPPPQAPKDRANRETATQSNPP
jgi:predicted  nucleic acid-binding Zn-ribbon protein